jgi:DNA-binding phage protein
MARKKARVRETFSRYDTADYLKSEDDIAAYLDAVMQEGAGNPSFDTVLKVMKALGLRPPRPGT